MSEAVRIDQGPRPESARRRGIPLAKSVQAKFLLYVVPLVLVSTVVVFGLFEWKSRRTAEQQLQAKLDKLIDIQSSVLAESLWNVADQQIKLILSALLTDPDVLAAAVYDERDRLVAEVGETQGFETTRSAEKRDVYCDAGDQDVRIRDGAEKMNYPGA